MIAGLHFIYCILKTDEPNALECGVRCRMMAEGCNAYTYDAETNSCSSAKVRCRIMAEGCNAYTNDADTNSCSAAKVRCSIKDAMHIHMMLIQTPALLLR